MPWGKIHGAHGIARNWFHDRSMGNRESSIFDAENVQDSSRALFLSQYIPVHPLFWRASFLSVVVSFLHNFLLSFCEVSKTSISGEALCADPFHPWQNSGRDGKRFENCCAKLVKPKQSRGNLGSAWSLPCFQKGAVFRSHADVGALRSAFISYPCAFLKGPTSSTFAMLAGFPAVPCNSEVRFTRLKHPKARPCNFCKSHHIKSIIFPKI